MQNTTYLILFCLLILSCTNTQSQEEAYAEKRTTPFTAVKWENEEPVLQIENRWYELLSMGKYTKTYLLENCQAIYPSDWKQRFGEDFVEFLWQLGINPLPKETFVLKNDEGNIDTLNLTFTKENRQKTYDYYRNHTEDLRSPDFDEIADKTSRIKDLEFLRKIIHTKYAYANLKGIDTDQEIDAIITNLPERSSSEELSLHIQELLIKYGDGHSKMETTNFNRLGLLPFTTTHFQGQIVCHKKDGLLSENYPFLHAINGIEVAKLLEISNQYLTPQGSPQFIQYRGARALKYMGFILSRINRYEKTVEVLLRNEEGNLHSISIPLFIEEQEDSKEQEVGLFTRIKETYNNYQANPFHYHEMEGKIGYLKIDNMISLKPEEQVEEIMEKTSKIKGLIIDVRNNGGGGRGITDALLPYFLKESQAPLVANLAKCRTNLDMTPKEGFLSNRLLYPISSSSFSEEEKSFLTAFQQDFQPDWSYDPNKYSAWHYYLIRKEPNKAFFNKPVVILMNGGCYSATDIFLAAFNELENVQLMGTKSGGGSGRTQSYTLPYSRLSLRLSSMISFQPTGTLYDGIGVRPDSYVEQSRLSDILGTTDTQLEHAITYIQTKNKP